MTHSGGSRTDGGGTRIRAENFGIIFVMKLYVATHNRHKLAEIAEILPAFIRANERENALFLAENELLAPASAREGAVLAAEMGDAELSARLARAGGAAAEDDFDLEEL